MRNSVIKFWMVFRLVWVERLAYRLNFFLEILSGVLSSLIVVFLWMAIYRSAGREIIGGFSIGEMVTYLLGGGVINSFILTTAENPETSQSIQDGSLSGLLIKPVSPYWVWFVRDLGAKSFYFLLGLTGYGVVFLLFREYLVLSAAWEYFLFFLLSLAVAGLLQFFLFQCLSLLAFWVENTYGIRFTMRVVMEVAGGAIIPLSFFPEIFQKIFLSLPFPFLIYLPMSIYLGKVEISRVPFELSKAAAWTAGLALLSMMIWKKGIRQYVAQGD